MKRFPPHLALIAAFLVPFYIYLRTLNPALFRNDSPETVVGCNTLGLVHAPSYPLFMLMGRLFSFLPLGNPALTLNLFSAFLASLASVLFFLNARFLLGRLCLGEKIPVPSWVLDFVSAAGAVHFSLSQTVWGNALAAKGGIYVCQILLELAFFYLIQRGLAQGPRPLRRTVLLFTFLFALGFCNHWPTQVLLAVVLGLFALSYFLKPRPFLDSSVLGVKHWATAAVLFLCALSLYLYLPIRASALPPIDFGAPTHFHRLWNTVFRISYIKSEAFFNAPTQSLLNLPVKMEYIADHILHEFCPLFYLFIAWGIGWLYLRDRLLTLAALSLFALVLFTNILYLQAPPIAFWHIGDHLLTDNWVEGLLGCAGFMGMVSWARRQGRFFLFYGALLVIGGSLPWAYGNGIQTNDQTRQFLYYGYGQTLLKSLPRNSVYFAEVDDDYFSTLYLREVLHQRSDIHLFLAPFLDQPYQYWNALAREKGLFTENTPTPFDENRLFLRLASPGFTYPVFCTYPNGSFSEDYLKFNQSFSFKPYGLATCLLFSGKKAGSPDNFALLTDFYRHYLEEELRNPNPVNGLLREICAHPLINEANYESYFGNSYRRDWYYLAALSLIQEQSFFEETLREYRKGIHP